MKYTNSFQNILNNEKHINERKGRKGTERKGKKERKEEVKRGLTLFGGLAPKLGIPNIY